MCKVHISSDQYVHNIIDFMWNIKNENPFNLYIATKIIFKKYEFFLIKLKMFLRSEWNSNILSQNFCVLLHWFPKLMIHINIFSQQQNRSKIVSMKIPKIMAKTIVTIWPQNNISFITILRLLVFGHFGFWMCT